MTIQNGVIPGSRTTIGIGVSVREESGTQYGHPLVESPSFSYPTVPRFCLNGRLHYPGELYTSADMLLLIDRLSNTWKYFRFLQLIYNAITIPATLLLYTSINNLCMKILASATCKWSNNGCEGPCRSPIDPIDISSKMGLCYGGTALPALPLRFIRGRTVRVWLNWRSYRFGGQDTDRGPLQGYLAMMPHGTLSLLHHKIVDVKSFVDPSFV